MVPDPLARTLAAGALVVLLAACGTGTTDAPPATPSTVTVSQAPGGLTRPTVLPSNLPACKYPLHVATPTWLPVDLPFPVGTYTYQVLPDSNGYHRALLLLPTTLDKLTRFVLTQWPKAGWVLGRGDSEAGEVEDQFVKSPAVGAFKAVSEYCAPGFSRMLMVFTEQTAVLPGFPSPSGSSSPLVTSPSPTG
ncbi:MAG: hypothetical protein M3Q23_08400 [Actinomycetota bacterium]|nr:hypothetical protein [Actinomycetota bacterium]